MRLHCQKWSAPVAGLLFAVLSGCATTPLYVAGKSLDTPAQHIKVTVTFSKPVNPSTVSPGTSMILAGPKNPNANGNLSWAGPNLLVFESVAAWSDIATGGSNAGFTLTLKSSIQSPDGTPINQCKTGQPKDEQPGDCVLWFYIPG